MTQNTTLDDAARHSIGANTPPEPIDVKTRLAVSHAALIQSAAELATKAQHIGTIGLDDSAALESAIKLVKDIRAKDGEVDATRKAEKKPLDEQIAAVQDFFTPAQRSLASAKSIAERAINDRNNRAAAAEQQRLRGAAEAARAASLARIDQADSFDKEGSSAVTDALVDDAQQKEAAAAHMDKLATGPAQDLNRAATAAGTVSSSLQWVFIIQDESALRDTLGPLGPFFTTADLEKAVRAYMKSTKAAPKPLAGVEFAQASKVNIR